MKNKFITSTIILMIFTIITKLLGFVIRIIFTRVIGDGITLYSLIMPTYSLLLAICTLGLPYAISTIMARNNIRGIHILASILPIAILFNIIIITLVIIFAPFLSNNLLNNPNTYYPILSITIVLPFASISGILKGYYFGKQNVIPNSISNVIEQITRLVLILIFIPKLLEKSIIHATCGYIVISAITELVQITIYLIFAPKNIKISLSDLIIKPKIQNQILSLSIPNISGRIIGNICYFLEPIILTNILLLIGYSNGYIIKEYAIYNAYVIPLLTMGSFFTQALNTTLIPEISKNYNNKTQIKRRLFQSLLISITIGIFICMILYFKGSTLLKIIFNTNEGIEYLKFLAIFFPLFYLEGPLMSTLQGLNLSVTSMKITLYGCIIKLITIVILSLFSIGIYGLIISEIVDILVVLYLCIKKLKQIKYI